MLRFEIRTTIVANESDDGVAVKGSVVSVDHPHMSYGLWSFNVPPSEVAGTVRWITERAITAVSGAGSGRAT